MIFVKRNEIEPALKRTTSEIGKEKKIIRDNIIFFGYFLWIMVLKQT